MKGKIYLIPNLLSECEPSMVLPEGVIRKIYELQHFVVENTRTARRFLIRLKHPLRPDDLFFYELDKHKPEEGIDEYIKICLSGRDVGIISEAGMPGIADPGSLLVLAGHKNGLQVIPYTGPSSIFLALSSSGLNGQNFVFHGYLPHRIEERQRKIREMETDSVRMKQTQIFIETPYRSKPLFDELTKFCNPTTLLCLACNISSENEFIRTLSIQLWQNQKPEIDKQPCVFLLLRH